jgi:hypothetical protein
MHEVKREVKREVKAALWRGNQFLSSKIRISYDCSR